MTALWLIPPSYCQIHGMRGALRLLQATRGRMHNGVNVSNARADFKHMFQDLTYHLLTVKGPREAVVA